MKIKNFFLSIVVLFILLLAVVPTFAQEDTPTAEGESAVVAPVVVAEPETVEVPVEVWRELNESSRVRSWLDMAGGLLIAMAGGGTFAAVLGRLDKRTKDEAERNYQALPPVWQTSIMGFLGIAEEMMKQASAALAVMKEITDGKPNTDPTTVNKPERIAESAAVPTQPPIAY